ncbi:MAG: nitrite/sulfite reductase [Actinobacteria bacterium]|nr:nitrite/sulfite reductase [Actinomycetota bacterium]
MSEFTIDAESAADIAKFEIQLARYLSGDLDDDVFRVFRLNNGIYGQRQGGHNQMIRIKAPYGTITAAQLDRMGDLAVEYSRGWGHLTTRQAIQFHYVQLERVPDLLRDIAMVGLTSREACGDTVRNVQGCHLAGACPSEILDITPWAEATFKHFLRNPLGQRLPRKFKINFSGCATDCGQAMFNDVGIIAVTRTTDAGDIEPGFRVFIAGGLGANPHAALALEPFTAKEDLLPTIESVLRVFEQTGNRDNKLRARMKWVVDNLGFEEVQRRVLTVRKFLLGSSTWPGGIPMEVIEAGDSPAGRADLVDATAMGQGTPVVLRRPGAFERWEDSNVIRGAAKGTVSAIAHARLGDVTAEQFRGLAAIVREFGVEVRVTNRQNFALRNLSEEQVPLVFDRLTALDMASPSAELVSDVVACPGADTCNLAVTQSRGLADAIEKELHAEGLAEVGGLRINISGCPNSCGQHHVADIGFHGAERRAHGKSAPGYTMLLGGFVGEERVEFGERATRLPAKAAPQAVVQVVRRFNDERLAGESFRGWIDRSGGIATLGTELKKLDHFPTPEDGPDFYVDYDETGPYTAEVGESECAT